MEGNLPFLPFTLYLKAISEYKPLDRGAYIWRGDLTEGFLLYEFGGLIFREAYTWWGLFSEFYGMDTDVGKNLRQKNSTLKKRKKTRNIFMFLAVLTNPPIDRSVWSLLS